MDGVRAIQEHFFSSDSDKSSFSLVCASKYLAEHFFYFAHHYVR